MAQATAIEWTDVSWNPVHGCSKVSPGCAHCYAETLSLRYRQTTKPWTPEHAAENVTLKPHKLREPLSNAKPWDKPCRVFVNSMSDLFHELVPDEYIAQVFGVMANAPQHTFQVLTKRPERMSELLRSWRFHKRVLRAISEAKKPSNGWAHIAWSDDDFLDNVWLGTSIENRRFVDRADHLRRTPAAVRFISAEPLLGSLAPWCNVCGDTSGDDLSCPSCHGRRTPSLDLTDVDWLIVGGESGAGHRRIEQEWVRELRDMAAMEGTAFFFKQWGGSTSKAGGRTLDGRIYDEMPDQYSRQRSNSTTDNGALAACAPERTPPA